MKTKLLFAVVLTVLLPVFHGTGQLYAHGSTVIREITGTVKDADTGETLVGCTVTVKGTTKGVITDVDGNFSINTDNDNDVLVFAFIGYETQEIVPGNRSQIEVSLVSNAAALKEVVVIGYGSTQSKDITGSAKSIKSEDFNKGIINSPEQLLQGKVAGVNINASSGEPGSPLNITVRGPGGVRTGSTPLFVIDGFALDNSSAGGATNPLAFLNPADIESIDILKDASATAIYGSRGANGVVLITTKKGKEGTSKLSYSGSVGFSTMANPIDVFTADEFRKQMAALNVDYVDDGGNTNWQKEISRTAVTQNHNVAMSGGTEKLKYFGSFGVQKQQGILKGSDLNRYNGRVNLNQSLLKDRLNVDVNFSASSTTNNRPPIQGMIGSALVANPTYKPYNSDGSINQYADGTNPLLTLELDQDMTKSYRILGNIAPSLTLAKGLVYRLNFGIDVTNTKRDFQSLPYEQPLRLGRLENTNTENTNRLIENYLTYTFKNSLHNLSALVGHSYQKIFLQGRTWSINNFPVNGIDPQYNPGLGQLLDLNNNKPSGYATINELQSFFSRATYQLKDRYLLTATVRVDGSSKFGANNKYGVFPSFSAGWRISEEAFMANSPFDDLKLRAGYGLTGNQEIPSKITQALFTSSVSSSTSYPLGSGNDYPAGTTYARLANPDIQWEVSTQTDLGIDYSLWSGRLSGAIDYFHKVSNDILLEVIPSDPVQPAGTYWTNVHDMKVTNQGVELDVLYRQRLSKDMSFDIGGNITFIDNIVKGSPYSVIPSGSASGSGLTSATINGYINGQPIGTFFLKEFTGLDENGESVYRDVDGDGIITDNDRVAAGTALPKQMYNINGSFNYKGFDMSFNFNGVAGNKVYDNTANANFYKLRLSKGLNTTAEAVEFPNESLNNSAPISTRYLKSGSFFRLNNLALGYNFNTTKLGISEYIPTLKLSLTGQNLFRITKYNGYDPDVNTNRNIDGISSYGIDYLSYPKARSFIIGLNVGL
ncbi:TonB-dependent receptor [Marinilongibacter aquaticus]|uniref:SusC/RagA family TonB-linked outer membrane protein n=1 Tax=Marinilongibacter aquaticus TaxID=2975157 RepID=UPI0021BD6A78|nr:TonB-dependent receptor [Marinilongibacter aquaticus]UBM59033.1 TonB-dependent receptor [Marinilongibacter aquaticus]